MVLGELGHLAPLQTCSGGQLLHCEGARCVAGRGAPCIGAPPALLTHPGSICIRVLIAALRQDLGHATQAGLRSSTCWPGEMGGLKWMWG